MTILCGIDGTGPGSDIVYKTEFENTFVSRILRGSPIAAENKLYLRGPDIFGLGLMRSIRKGYDFVQERYRESGGPVLLTGYSRGGAAAIVIAQRLRSQNIPVSAMLLFDAVGRHPWVNAKVIPDNVSTVLHLRRDPGVNSRKSFGSTGTKWLPPTVYEERAFFCTHGGIGGKLWDLNDHSVDDPIHEGFPDGLVKVTFAQDEKMSQEVWQSAQPFLEQYNFF